MTEYEIKRLEDRIRELWNEKEDWKSDHEHNLELMKGLNKRIADLENKIADIKANCDFAIEGRDIKIMELEQQINEMKGEHKQEILDLVLSNSSERAELEQRLEQTEKDLADYQFNYPKIKELEKENADLRDNYDQFKASAIPEIERLQKENAELKAEIENDRDLPTVAYMQGAEKQKKKDEKQLAKAKELLTKWVELFKPKGGNIPPTPIQVDTEQFLKEIEK